MGKWANMGGGGVWAVDGPHEEQLDKCDKAGWLAGIDNSAVGTAESDSFDIDLISELAA